MEQRMSDIDHRARWKAQRQQDCYTDMQLNWPDILVGGSKQCLGSIQRKSKGRSSTNNLVGWCSGRDWREWFGWELLVMLQSKGSMVSSQSLMRCWLMSANTNTDTLFTIVYCWVLVPTMVNLFVADIFHIHHIHILFCVWKDWYALHCLYFLKPL